MVWERLQNDLKKRVIFIIDIIRRATVILKNIKTYASRNETNKISYDDGVRSSLRYFCTLLQQNIKFTFQLASKLTLLSRCESKLCDGTSKRGLNSFGTERSVKQLAKRFQHNFVGLTCVKRKLFNLNHDRLSTRILKASSPILCYKTID